VHRSLSSSAPRNGGDTSKASGLLRPCSQELSVTINDKPGWSKSQYREQLSTGMNVLVSNRALVDIFGPTVPRDEIDIGRAIALHGFQGVLQ
jgi:hypothetical protein